MLFNAKPSGVGFFRYPSSIEEEIVTPRITRINTNIGAIEFVFIRVIRGRTIPSQSPFAQRKYRGTFGREEWKRAGIAPRVMS